jgi:segregation and condensation protein B
LRRKEREGRLSPAALETLAVIAYKQPINKADLEAIRGVACGPILKTLLDRGLIQIAGRAESLGRPLLYGTTRRFLESFGLHSIRELPQPELEAKLLAQAAEPPPSGEQPRAGLETTLDEGPGSN